MHKIFSTILLFANMATFSLAGELIQLDKVENFDIKYKDQVQNLKGSLFVDDALEAQKQINEQQKADMQDIENLWNATVSNNPAISFCLKKLAIPAEQRRIHSSLMAKSMSAIISGAALLPSFLGMNYGVQSGAYAAGRLAHNLINKENNDKLQNPSLTDTEAIELASLVETLQDEIVVDYYKYKGALIKLKKCREQLLLHNKNYSTALDENNSLDIAITSSQWEDELIEEYKLKQEAKKYRLALQRLAGKKTVDALNVVQIDLVVQDINKEDLNLQKKLIKLNKELE
ncbi:MAG: hypothetical protein IJB79_09275 [Candidatus Gastranaerophilales bacterium]|nr:hypothetical protein [bacterium]MBQ4647525.1 hypothetical protein [Candidatus Gastranaerophilales bacterium]